MLLGDHVVDWKREERILVLVNMAVFTPTTSSLSDLLPEPRIHQAAPLRRMMLRALA